MGDVTDEVNVVLVFDDVAALTRESIIAKKKIYLLYLKCVSL